MRWHAAVKLLVFQITSQPQIIFTGVVTINKTNFLSFCGVKGGVVVETGCLSNLALQLVHVGGLPQHVYTHNMVQVQQEKCFENP